jgi:hypothetical protein
MPLQILRPSPVPCVTPSTYITGNGLKKFDKSSFVSPWTSSITLKQTVSSSIIPVILFTVLGPEVRLRFTDETGVENYIQKPFAREEFLLKVEI